VTRTAIVWFRRDLRLSDNPSLWHATRWADAVIPVFVDTPAHLTGAAAHAWLAASVTALDASLAALGSALVVRRGPTERALAALVAETGATRVYASRGWDALSRAEEPLIAGALGVAGAELIWSESRYLVTPGSLMTGSGTPYRVFTPYHRAWQTALDHATHASAPEAIPAPERWPASDHAVTAARAVPTGWTPGETGARDRLERFISRGGPDSYEAQHDRPDLPGTSELSPHLAFGEISAGRVLAAVRETGTEHAAAHPFVRQLAWRDFAADTLLRAPEMDREPLNARFARMPWREDSEDFAAWREGRTGFPLVDAGMRQLAETGWMHNRVRMVVSSFLTKDLLIRWQEGEAYFFESLLDADVAQNSFNWQWVAGSGADAAPYFRIFNPTTQGRRFDPDGSYVRRWAPELAAVPTRWLHEPHAAPADVLRDAGIVGGKGYPQPVLDHAVARLRALAAYEAVRRPEA
jgi:deoxyribodipyrimidine photo-lyase